VSKNLDIQIVTAASILGLKPSGVEKLPATVLDLQLASRLSSINPIIDVPVLNHLYSTSRDESTKVLNVEPLKVFSKDLCNTVRRIVSPDKFTLVLGGDCSILIGIMAGLKSRGKYGLIFMDAHADFYQPEKSITGEAADMELALITGRGPLTLTDIDHLTPYVNDENVIHLGQRDMEETRKYNSQDIRQTAIKCIDEKEIRQLDIRETIVNVDKFVRQMKVDGFWIHFDTDVISDEDNPAVDYRLPGGLSVDQCQVLLKNFVEKYPVVGMSVTIFNPSLDNEGTVASKLTTLLVDVLT
jgi:arginase